MVRFMVMAYGVLCYLAFQVAFLYFIGFLCNAGVPKSIDGDATMATSRAIVINVGLIVLFGLQHSVMARRGFKKALSRLIPESVERSTYVLATSVVLGLVYALWQPLPQVIWQVDGDLPRAALWLLFGLGTLVLVGTTFMIDHFDLYGLRQVYLRWRQRSYTSPPFRVAWLYRFVRHPLYLGFFVMFWSTPDMTLGHFVFALGMSLYILIGVRFEERDLLAAFGDTYARYQQQVPMILPGPRRSGCPIGQVQHSGAKSVSEPVETS